MSRPVTLEPSQASRTIASRQGEIHRSAAVSTARALGVLSDELEGVDAGLSQHVADVSLRLAMALGLPSEIRVQAYLTGFVRDIGKVAVGGSFWRVGDPRTPGERTLVESHPLAGAVVARGLRGLGDVEEGVRHHHERWDGSGYPARLQGEAIPLPARIVAVAEAYVRSTWGSGAGDGPAAVEGVVAGSGSLYDPTVVELLVELARRGLLEPRQLSSR